MPRIARVCAEGYPHHITQRGNNKEKTFFDDEDKRFYLETLQRYKDKYKMKLLAYCLMGNHVHILAIPEEETSLARNWENIGTLPIFIDKHGMLRIA